jgi:hypothetical protein
MYNLEVTQDHTYTVGTEQWVVHNEGACLYRGGNTTDSKISKVRVGVDVFPDEEGLIHPGEGGISLNSDPGKLKLSGRKPWKISGLPEGLQTRSDH